MPELFDISLKWLNRLKILGLDGLLGPTESTRVSHFHGECSTNWAIGTVLTECLRFHALPLTKRAGRGIASGGWKWQAPRSCFIKSVYPKVFSHLGGIISGLWVKMCSPLLASGLKHNSLPSLPPTTPCLVLPKSHAPVLPGVVNPIVWILIHQRPLYLYSKLMNYRESLSPIGTV